MRNYSITSISTKEDISVATEQKITKDLIYFVERELSLCDLAERIQGSITPFLDFLIAFFSKYENWNNWIEDMLHLAQTYPDYTFIVDGDDGEDGKMWRTYFRGDKVFTADARIVYDTPEWYEEG